MVSVQWESTSILEHEQLVEYLDLHSFFNRNPLVDTLPVPSADLAAQVLHEVGAVPAGDLGMFRVNLVALNVQSGFLGITSDNLTLRSQVYEDELVLVRPRQTFEAVVDDAIREAFW